MLTEKDSNIKRLQRLRRRERRAYIVCALVYLVFICTLLIWAMQ